MIKHNKCIFSAFQRWLVEKQKKYIVLPYSNNKVEAFAGRPTKLVNETFDVELRVAFKAPKEIGNMFPFRQHQRETCPLNGSVPNHMRRLRTEIHR